MASWHSIVRLISLLNSLMLTGLATHDELLVELKALIWRSGRRELHAVESSLMSELGFYRAEFCPQADFYIVRCEVRVVEVSGCAVLLLEAYAAGVPFPSPLLWIRDVHCVSMQR